MGKNTTNDMTQGNCMRLLVQFFLPILAGNLFQQLYSFADSMVVGKGIGDTALAAVGNTSSVHFLIIGFAIGLTGGLGICISQSFGSGNYEKLRKELAMSVWICLAIGIVITVVSLAFMRQLFKMCIRDSLNGDFSFLLLNNLIYHRLLILRKESQL